MSKAIFNSLGSNYDWQDAELAIISGDSRQAHRRLKAEIEKTFNGSVLLTYKGRDAITLALQSLGVGKGDGVITQAFTCCAVEAGIRRSGARVVFADVARGKLNPGVAELEKALSKDPKSIKAVLVQHTLGFPAEIKQIRQWCDENKLFLIEDLAQALGGTSIEGDLLGSMGNAVVLSFGRDKIVDAVSGGAVIGTVAQTGFSSLSYPPLINIWHDRLYPLITNTIRATFSVGVGKAIHRLAVGSGFITSPAGSPLPSPALFPPTLAKLALKQWSQLEKSIKHRRKMALAYDQLLPPSVKIVSPEEINVGAVARYPIRVKNPDSLAKKLSLKGIFVTDRWYRKVVDCGKIPFQTEYVNGACPRAERLATKILTLPVHRGMTLEDIRRISQEINHELEN